MLSDVHTITRHILTRHILIGLLLSATGGCDDGRVFPSRPIEIICPWSAGGGTDRVARQLGMQLERRLGVPVHVVNATGGSGVVGFSRGALARPDGHTLTLMTVELSMLHWRGLTDLTTADFAPLALLNQDAAAVFVRDDAPYAALADLEAVIRARPGMLTAGGTAQGAVWHAAVVGWLDARGLPGDAVTWVSINGAGPSLQELAAGGLDLVCCSLPEADAMLAGGRVRCLGVMADDRVTAFPDVPTFREQGIEWTLVGWRAVGVPAATPADRVGVLAVAVAAEVEGESFRTFMADAGFNHAFLEPDACAGLLADQDALYGRLLRLEAFGGVAADALGPFVFPGVAAVLLAVAIVVVRLGEGVTPSATVPPSRRGVVNVVAVVLGVAAFALLVVPLGFTLAAIALLAGLLLVCGVRPVPAVGIAVVTASVAFFLFGVALRVPLPRGPLGW